MAVNQQIDATLVELRVKPNGSAPAHVKIGLPYKPVVSCYVVYDVSFVLCWRTVR